MKKRNVLVPALCLLVTIQSYAQMAVMDAGVATLLQMTKADQAIYYVQSIAEQVKSAENTYNQFMNMLRTEQRALNNLKNVTKVRNFDDFMQWNNRQLYLEKQAENRFHNMGVKIGGQTYRLADVDKIPEAMRENYGDEYWNDFSEEERRKMWTNLGLTPSNYVYVKTWQAREAALAALMIGGDEIRNEENMAAHEKWRTLLDEYHKDKDKPEDEKIQEKRVLMDIAAILMDTNILHRSMAYDRELEKAKQLAKEKQAEAPMPSPAITDSYHARPYRRITD
jgi:tetrahydromethanopterin S-methyltransferase subunit B